MITHIVLFKLKDAAPAVILKTRDVLLNMKGKIPVLKHLEVGTDVLRSERSYDLALVSRFDSLADLKVYQEHPVHQEVLKYMAGVREHSAAVDFEGRG
ncbi:MAG TPA: Dabb family protein [Nitrospiria bacterium]|nr:Dabb family protein [Nitrospiria bacterium]